MAPRRIAGARSHSQAISVPPSRIEGQKVRPGASKQIPADRTIVGWSAKLRAAGRCGLAATFDTDIVEDFHLVKALGLPTYDAHFLRCSDFMRRFQHFKKEFVHPRYYLNLIPSENGLRKFSLVGFNDLGEAPQFIRTHVKSAFHKYMLRISEFETNIYGGSMMSAPGIVRAELSPGLQQLVAYGSAQVFGVTLTSFDKWARYTAGDTDIRLLLWRSLEAIMIRGGRSGVGIPPDPRLVHQCGRYWFIKGYFEFAYTKVNEQAPLRLVFFDVKLRPAYYNIEPQYPL